MIWHSRKERKERKGGLAKDNLHLPMISWGDSILYPGVSSIGNLKRIHHNAISCRLPLPCCILAKMAVFQQAVATL